jgi:HAD superfamily hydrolase (TIGR01549 family)
MIKAVLLDLDNTLLRNPSKRFTVEYFRLLDLYFANLWDVDRISQSIIASVVQMGRDIEHSNMTAMLRPMAEAAQRTTDEVQRAFADFLTAVYPQLRNCVEPVPHAAQLVQTLQHQGYAVAIATNPVYPAEAIRQRLIWAKLPSRFEDYAFVSHAENTHFIKPDAAYYAEIIARIGVEPDETVMIGDSLENDIEPAASIGIHTYHVTDESLHEFNGQLKEFETLQPAILTATMIEPQLRGNVGALFGLVDGIKPHYWSQHPDPNEWSPFQIICHLLEVEAPVHRARLQRILTEENPFIADPGQPLGPREAQPCDDSGLRATQRFLEARRQTIALLRKFPADAWVRPARHSIFGPTTLLEMAHFTAQHDRLHLTQLCRTVGNCE